MTSQAHDPALSDHPNPWSVLIEGTRTIVALSTGLLGLTATFATDLFGESTHGWLYAAWAFLGLSIAGCIYTYGDIQAAVRNPNRVTQYESTRVLGPFNASFIFLGLGVALVAVAALLDLNSTDTDPSLDSLARNAEEAAELFSSETSMDIRSIERSHEGTTFFFESTDQGLRVRVTLDSAGELVTSEEVETDC
ncbi:hypothetical protein [Salsipaludibacter albus]|uniref:hypothetical protein n=1 Tax=Salsipaludibacter albus TaxID=2849650 RepID=UPI001EE43744|nr:hypothetical protein [Salsipaludibacter albus]MBY5163148.1 hypothetical protein [Salsipaludibacter albus]